MDGLPFEERPYTVWRMERVPKHHDELREWFAGWLHEYNYERLHMVINFKTPYEIAANLLSS